MRAKAGCERNRRHLHEVATLDNNAARVEGLDVLDKRIFGNSGEFLRNEGALFGDAASQTDPLEETQAFKGFLRFIVTLPTAPNNPIQHLLGRTYCLPASTALLGRKNGHFRESLCKFLNKMRIGTAQVRSNRARDLSDHVICCRFQTNSECIVCLLYFRFDVDGDEAQTRTDPLGYVGQVHVCFVRALIHDEDSRRASISNIMGKSEDFITDSCHVCVNERYTVHFIGYRYIPIE